CETPADAGVFCMTSSAGSCCSHTGCLYPLIFAGCDSLIFFESADKITEIVKAVPVSDLCVGIVRSGKLVAGLLDPQVARILQWRRVRHVREKPTEIFRRHG